MPRRDDDDDDDAETMWDVLGRGTAAGRAVFNLYAPGDVTGKRYGRLMSDYNVAKLQVRHASDPSKRRAPPHVEETLKREARVASSKRANQRVNVPTPTGRRAMTEEEEEAFKFEAAKRATVCRKTEAEIRAKMEEDKPWERPPPRPSRRLIGEEGKLRHQRMVEFDGRPPEEEGERRGYVPPPGMEKADAAAAAAAAAAARAPPPPPPRRRTGETETEVQQIETLRAMFDDVANEIEEREVFMNEMRAAGAGRKHEHSVKAEIAERVSQLRRIDAMIRDLEASIHEYCR